MKINEIEKILNIPRASIRFYEKEGLFDPHRDENGYRDYSLNDIKTLKLIVILRKMGISIDQIRQILTGGSDLNEVVENNVVEVQEQMNNLKGALKLCNEVLDSKVTLDNIDVEAYWNRINEDEKNGESFASIVNDLLDFEMQSFGISVYNKDSTIINKLKQLFIDLGGALAVCGLVFGIILDDVWDIIGRLIAIDIFIAVIAGIIFFVKRRKENSADMLKNLRKSLCIISGLFLAAVLCSLVILLLNSKLHFWF